MYTKNIKSRYSLVDLATYGTNARKNVHSEVLIGDHAPFPIFNEGEILDGNATFNLVQDLYDGGRIVDSLHKEIESVSSDLTQQIQSVDAKVIYITDDAPESLDTFAKVAHQFAIQEETFQPVGDYKTIQPVVEDPTSSGNSISFVDSITQNENGVIAPTKKTIPIVSPSQAGIGGIDGLMSAQDKELLDNIDYSNKADKVVNAISGNFAGLDENGNITDSNYNVSNFATAVQGSKADTAIQVIKVNDAVISSINNIVNIEMPERVSAEDLAMFVI